MSKFLRVMTAFLVLVLAMSGMAAHAARVAPLFDPERVELKRVDGKPATAEQVHAAILNGAKMDGARMHWTVRSEAPGSLKLVFSGGTRYEGVVQVDYDRNGYLVRYANSIGLRYSDKPGRGPYIHRNYNKWIQSLLNNARIPGELEPVKIPTPKGKDEDKDDQEGDEQ